MGALLAFQRFDGSFNFDFPDLSELRKVTGDRFTALVQDIYAMNGTSALELKRPDLVTGTIAVVAFFKTKLQSCKHLWSLIVRKARL